MVVYIIDTSALIELARWYPIDRDFFKPIWEKIDILITYRKFMAPYEVYREIEKRCDMLFDWAKSRKNIFIHPTIDQIEFIKKIKIHYTRDYWKMETNKAGAWADPWIIALALHYKNNSLINDEVKIVTQENKNKPNRIPYIAIKFGINSLNVLEFLWEIGIR